MHQFCQKADYDTKVGEIEKKIANHDHNNKYINTQEFNKLTEEKFALRLKQANLATNSDIDDFVEKTNFDDKLKNLNKEVTANKKNMKRLKKKLNEVVQISEKGYFLLGIMYFTGDDGYQNF